jgi:hypothetical protein
MLVDAVIAVQFKVLCCMIEVRILTVAVDFASLRLISLQSSTEIRPQPSVLGNFDVSGVSGCHVHL